MKTLPVLLVVSSVASASFSTPPASPVSLRFAPDEGTVLTKTFRSEMTLGFEELTASMGGLEVPPEFLPDMDIQVTGTTHTVVTDRYVALADGRPATLLRTYDTVGSKDSTSFTGANGAPSSRALATNELLDILRISSSSRGTSSTQF